MPPVLAVASGRCSARWTASSECSESLPLAWSSLATWSSSMPYVPMNWMAAANAVMKYPLSALSASGELRLNAYSCMTSSQGTCACTVM